MKNIYKLSVKEISELQPTSTGNASEHRTVVGGLEITGEYDQSVVDRAIIRQFGDDCIAWDREPDDGDGCVHVIVCAKL